MSAAADRIRIEQEKLNEIRQEAARRMQKEWEDIQDKAKARLDAGRDGRLDEGKAEEQRRADAQRKADQDEADQQKADDQRQEDIRAEARAKARDETEKLVKEGLERHVSDRQERIMAGSSTGPAMSPRVMNDPVAMAAAVDHPALTDDEKLILSKAGYAIGEGWHNREAERKEQLMQGERDKRDDDRQKADARPDRESGARSANGDQQKDGQQQQEARPDFFEDMFAKERDRSQADRDKPAPERNNDQKQQEGQRQEQERPDYFEQIFSRTQDRAKTEQERDQAVSGVKENARSDHEDQQVGETVQDKGERANLESTGKVTVAQAEEMTHGKGSREHNDQQFEQWLTRNETKELDNAGVSRNPSDYERDDER